MVSAMKIGLTYDLRKYYIEMGYSEIDTAELDNEETIKAISDSIRRFGHQVDLVGNAKELIVRLSAGDRWDLVFNICEGMHGSARESQVPAILDVYGIPYTGSDALVLSICLNKGRAKDVLMRAGLPTLEYCEINEINEINDLKMQFPLFVKPISEGNSKGVLKKNKCYNLNELRNRTLELLNEFKQPVIVEPFISGSEYTVGIIGTGKNSRVIGTLEILINNCVESEIYSYSNKIHCATHIEYRYLKESEINSKKVEDIALKAWQTIGGRDFGRIDLRCDSSESPQILEINPLPGLDPEHSDLPILCKKASVSYDTLIGMIIDSASLRILNPLKN